MMVNFIHRHRIKIIVILFFAVGVILGDYFNLTKLYYGYDKNQYNEACRLFAKNEKEALDILNNISIEDSEYSIRELEEGMNLWIENGKIMGNVSRIENITEEIKKKSSKLKEYCRLRIIYYSYLKKNLENGEGDVYSKKINELESNIDNFLKENNLDSN